MMYRCDIKVTCFAGKHARKHSERSLCYLHASLNKTSTVARIENRIENQYLKYQNIVIAV